MINLIEYGGYMKNDLQMNEGLLEKDQDYTKAYNDAIKGIKSSPTKAVDSVNKYQAKTKEEETDKNMYMVFVKSVIDKNPLAPAPYIGKRLLANKALLGLITGAAK